MPPKPKADQQPPIPDPAAAKRNEAQAKKIKSKPYDPKALAPKNGKARVSFGERPPT